MFRRKALNDQIYVRGASHKDELTINRKKLSKITTIGLQTVNL